MHTMTSCSVKRAWPLLLAKSLALLLAFSGLLAIATNAQAVACTSIASSAWNVQATWGAVGGCAGATGGIPGAGDTVTIANGNAVTVTAAAAATSITIAGGLTATGLTITGAFPLTVSGAVAINAPTGAVTKQIVVGTGTLSAGSITITAGAAATNISRVTLTTGTITVSGNISFGGLASAARLIYTGTGTVNLTGNLGGGGTLTTVANCILNFNGSAAQTAASYTTYRILKVNNAAGLTMTGTSTVATLTIGDVTASSAFNDGGFQVTSAGTLNLTSGTFKLGAAAAATTFPAFATRTISAGTTVEYASGIGQTVSITPAYRNLTFSGAGTKTTAAGTLSVAGNWDASSTTALDTNNTVVSLTGNLSGTGNITQGTGAMTVSGNLGGSGTLTQGAALITVAGDWTRSGTFTASASGVTLTGANKQITGAAAGITFTTLTVNGTYTNNNAASITVSTALAGSSGLTNPATGTLNIAGTSGISALTATASGNTVNYTGAAQTVKATAYHHLGLGTSGAKTMTSVTTIGGNLSISGTATMTGNAGFTVTGALNYSSTAGTTTLTAATPVSIGTFNQSGAGGTLNDNGNTITVTGTGASTWTKSAGTFTASGTVKFTGAAPQIGASNFNNLTIDVATGTATLTGNATPAGDLAVTTGTLDLSSFTADRSAAGGTLTVANAATLKIGGSNTFPSNYATHTLGDTSTVEYSGTSQVVAAEASGYGNLTLSGTGLTGAASLIVRGNWTETGTFSPGTGTVTLNGTSAQTISGTSPVDFYNLTVTNAASPNITLATNVTVSNTLTGTVTLTSTCATDYTLTSASPALVLHSCPTTPAGFNCVESGASAGTGHIYTKLAGTGFSVDVAAITSGGAVETTYASKSTAGSSVTVELVDGSGATACASRTAISPAVSQTLTFIPASLGRKAAASMTVAKAYANLRCRVIDSALSITSCSSDNFSVRPGAATLSTTATAVGPSATATPVIKAGTAFTIGAATTTGATDLYTGTLTLDTGKLTAQLPSNVSTQQSGGTVGTLTVSPAVQANASPAQSNNAAWDEVGYLYAAAGAFRDDGYTAVDSANGDCVTSTTADAYLADTLSGGQYGCSIGNQTAVSFGRFVPDRFALTAGSFIDRAGINTGSSEAICASSFTYIGEDFKTTFTLIAQNSTSGTTQNYIDSGNPANTHAKFDLTTWSNFVFTATGGTLGIGGAASSGTWSNGSASVTATHKLTRSSPVVPYTSFSVSAQPTYTDGTATYALSPSTAVHTGTSEQRYGRLRLSNAFGSPLLPLAVPAMVQYYNGTDWTTNTLDSCNTSAWSVLPAGSNALLGTGASGNTAVSLGPNVAAGIPTVTASAPGSGGLGYQDLTVVVPDYLKFPWAGCTNQTSFPANCLTAEFISPPSRVSFGIYKGNNRIIYRRERY